VIFTAGPRRYRLVEDWPKLPADVAWTDVCAVGVGPADRVHVLCRGEAPLLVFEADGALLEVIDGFEGPAGVVTDDEGYAFVGEEEWRVSVLDPERRVVARWDGRDEPAGARTFVAPHSIAIDSRGSLYVGGWLYQRMPDAGADSSLSSG